MLTNFDLFELVIDLLQDFCAFLDSQDQRRLVQHLVLDEGIFVDQLVHIDVLMKEGVFVKAGGEEAAKL